MLFHSLYVYQHVIATMICLHWCQGGCLAFTPLDEYLNLPELKCILFKSQYIICENGFVIMIFETDPLQCECC